MSSDQLTYLSRLMYLVHLLSYDWPSIDVCFVLRFADVALLKSYVSNNCEKIGFIVMLNGLKTILYYR